MKLVAPEYYNKFKCIADKCNHNCCIGWEIDIDPHTFRYYKTIEGDLGKKLHNNIDSLAQEPHFILTEGERCPFLNCDGLCEIISSLGEDALCNICADHPRFRNYFADRTEIGLGLCCEEAARIILSGKYSSDLVILEDDCKDLVTDEDELIFFSMRSKIFSHLKDSQKSLSEIIDSILGECCIKSFNISLCDAADFLLSLEQLDSHWAPMVQNLKSCSDDNLKILDNAKYRTQIIELIKYFLYRHLPDSIYDGKFNARVVFSFFSALVITALCIVSGDESFEAFADIARMYSSEIEYSDENVELLADFLSDFIEE